MNLIIGWLYPDLMSTYGDRGNIIYLSKRCQWRGIGVKILPIDQELTEDQMDKIDIIFGGGAQDKEQEIVMKDLKGKKGEKLKQLIEKDIPALFVCGSPQLLGRYYEPSKGKRIEGLGIFDMVSVSPGPDKARCIGDIIARVEADVGKLRGELIVGFENHGGRSYLGKGAKLFARVISGFGNNGEDGSEGIIYKNSLGCYFHGPFLPKNPKIADYLIEKGLEVKYQTKISLPPLDDYLEQKARQVLFSRLAVSMD